MNHGRLVEEGTPDQILRNPQQAYTKRLITAIPVPDPDQQAERRVERRRVLDEQKAAGIRVQDEEEAEAEVARAEKAGEVTPPPQLPHA